MKGPAPMSAGASIKCDGDRGTIRAMSPMTENVRLPVGQIYPDPDRPRRPLRGEYLDELAQSMAAIGLIHPVIVCREGLRWLLVCGDRRLEAARRLGWKMICARAIPTLPPALRSVIWAAENLHRSAFSLIEMIDVVLSLKEAGMASEAAAQALGRKTTWVEALLAMARDPIARALLEAGRICSVEAWQQLMGLPSAARRRLLQSDEPITAERCERAVRPHQRKSSVRRRSQGPRA